MLDQEVYGFGTLYAAQASRVTKLEFAPALLLFKSFVSPILTFVAGAQRQQQSMPAGDGK
jgi:hypothetical protein